ncbi:unnamed protein product, partial [Mesorhabditis belari]|uniref:L-threonine 3-dehydrogenase, mitochondrial n=1 Tax=Mesorhabditis belari TaxID=2138241 RepID=A0AAF3FS99_9BILA
MNARRGLLFPSQAIRRGIERRGQHMMRTDPLTRFRALAESTVIKPKTLITGSLGQLGRGLGTMLRFMYGEESVVMTDIVKCDPNAPDVVNYSFLDVTNERAIEEAVVNNNIDTLVHFSALLSAVGEQNVPLAIEVNANASNKILEVARKHRLKVFIPSTIGAFGPTTPLEMTPDLTIQRPRTIYGVTKVYNELLGEYYAERFGVDFRCLRFPGIISATKPGGGTTDYAIQIFYDAILHGHHKCYLEPNTRLPMMYDTDCMAAIVFFLAAQQEQLSMRTYNVTGFSFTPDEIATAIRKVMPDFKITYENICPIRQKIANSWPKALADENARRDWGWHNDFDLDSTVQIMFALLESQIRPAEQTIAHQSA